MQDTLLIFMSDNGTSGGGSGIADSPIRPLADGTPMIADPSQRNNVAKDHPEFVSQMLAAYEAWWKETRPSYRPWKPVQHPRID